MGKAIVILSIVLGLAVVSGFVVFPEKIFRKEINQPVGEKETINSFNNSTSPVVTTKGESVEQDRGEVLKKDEMANPPGQGVYKWVDEKGTVNFSDNPTSSVITTKKGAVKQDGAEVLMRNEMANQKANKEATQTAMTDSEIQAKLLTMPTWRGSATSSGWGSSGTASGKS